MAQDTQIDISVVTPFYNEKPCLEEWHERLTKTLKALKRPYELIAVDDGSTDNSYELLQELCKKDSNMSALRLARNSGQSMALSAGFRITRGKYVVVMDGDLQNAPEDIPAFIKTIEEGYDLVSGNRQNRPEKNTRLLPSKIANWLIRTTTGCPTRDAGGFKCLRGNIAKRLWLRAGQHRLLPPLVHLMGGSVGEIPVEAHPRYAGESHYKLLRSLDVLIDIIMLWFQSSYKSRPLYLFGRFSLWTFIVASICLGYLAYDKLCISGSGLTERPAFYMCVVMYIGSMFMMGLGFVLELLSMILERESRHEGYVIASKSGQRFNNENQ